MNRNLKGQFTSEGLKRNQFAKGNKSNKTSIKKGQHLSIKTEFKKGFKQISPLNKKGWKHTEETRKKMLEAHQKFIGEKNPSKRLEVREKIRLSKIGKERLDMQGANHPFWNGGSSFEPYGIEFNKELKEKIRQRDQFRCQECFRHQDELYSKNGRKYKLLIHHINFNKQNNEENNLISLCRNCHLQTNYNRENWVKYFQTKICEIKS